eukprot:963247-Pyramimonas_sp.AAC.2
MEESTLFAVYHAHAALSAAMEENKTLRVLEVITTNGAASFWGSKFDVKGFDTDVTGMPLNRGVTPKSKVEALKRSWFCRAYHVDTAEQTCVERAPKAF